VAHLNQVKMKRPGLKREMTDTVSISERSRIMSGIHSENTSPEIMVRKGLHHAGFRFRLHNKALPGRPDVVLARHRTVVFVHGCFWHWHGCKRTRLPRTNSGYWRRKIENNRIRDTVNTEVLRRAGWRVETIWECEVKQNIADLVERLRMGTSRAS
jgi:DNA mismatch endonuclease (patch repair protein)